MDLLDSILALFLFLLQSFQPQLLLVIETTTQSKPPYASKARYLDSVGPIESKVRIIDPSVAKGYNSCDDLKEDIRNALKHFVNTIIVQEINFGAEYVK